MSQHPLFLRERALLFVSLVGLVFIFRVAYQEIPSEQKSLQSILQETPKASKTCRVTIYRDQPRYKLILDGKQGDFLYAYIKDEVSLTEEEKGFLKEVVVKKDGQRVRLKKGACKK